MPGRTAGRDDADHLVRTLFPIRMHHGEDDDVLNLTDRMPALFPSTYAFNERDAMRIVEDESCSFEINVMVCLVDPVSLHATQIGSCVITLSYIQDLRSSVART